MSTCQDKERQEALQKCLTVVSLMLRVPLSTELLGGVCKRLAAVCKDHKDQDEQILPDSNSPTGWLSPDELEKTYYNPGKGVLFLPKYNTET